MLRLFLCSHSNTQGRPVYITLPTDLAYAKISSDRLKVPLPRHPSPNDKDEESFVIDEIVKLVEEAGGDVVVLADACSIRHDVVAELKELLHKTGYPVYCAPMGKSAVDETYERYGGVSWIFLASRWKTDILVL